MDLGAPVQMFIIKAILLKADTLVGNFRTSVGRDSSDRRLSNKHINISGVMSDFSFMETITMCHLLLPVVLSRCLVKSCVYVTLTIGDFIFSKFATHTVVSI